MDVIAYFAGFCLAPDEITSVIDDYQALGVENILVVRGDEPRDKDFLPHPESFAYASDLMGYGRRFITNA